MMGKEKKPPTKREERRLKWWIKKNDTEQNEEKNEGVSEKKTERVSEKKTEDPSSNDALNREETSDDVEADSTETVKGKQTKKEKTKYYVLFVGNLPYTATEEDVRNHFQQIGGIKEIRLLTNKATGKSKGCAYIEFLNARVHKLALMLHHSKVKGRRINVEFTSAGRKTDRRTEQLKKKNKHGERFKVGPHFRAKISKLSDKDTTEES